MELHIGVLAIQGAFMEHESAIKKCLKENGGVLEGLKLQVHRVTEAGDVSGLDGLIIPGGESSVCCQILDDEMKNTLSTWASDDSHVLFGTCAGLILLSKDVENAMDGQVQGLSKLARMDITTSRNYFGRQLNSFEGQVLIKEIEVSKNITQTNTPDMCNGVFIRGPVVVSINSPTVKTLATLETGGKEVIVGVQDKNCIGLAFHPELTEDIRWHAYFLSMVIERKTKK